MKNIVGTIHCRGRTHCKACRAGTLAGFAIPVVCPFGDGRKVYQAPADACDHCEACDKPGSCPNVSRCCGGRVDVNFVTDCPKGLWKMQEISHDGSK